ncbi:MAG: peptidase domain-containing ABC transporter [Pseudomonadota bacterium]
MEKNIADGTELGANPRAEQGLRFFGATKLPIIRQTEAAECGLACLVMIANYHGYEIDLAGMRRKFSISTYGMTLKSIISIANTINLSARPIRTDIDALGGVELPCIIHWGLNHFVVLKSINRGRFTIHDPAFGIRKLTADEFSKNFTGVVLELYPSHSFEKKKLREKLSVSLFWEKITGLKRSLVLVISLSLILQIFALIAPLFMQTVVDDVLSRGDTDFLFALALGFGLLAIIQLSTQSLRELIILHMSTRLGMQMSSNLFRHLIRLPIDYFSKRHMGDIVSRFSSLGNVRNLLTTGMVAAIVDGVMVFITMIAMYLYSASLTLVAGLIVLLYVLLRWVLYLPFRRLSEEQIIASALENSHFMESMRAIQTIKLFRCEEDRQSQWQNRLADVINKKISIAKWTIGYTSIKNTLFGLESIIIIYLGAQEVLVGAMSLGMLLAFLSYKQRFIESIDRLIVQIIEFKMMDLHLDRLADIAFTPVEKSASDTNTEGAATLDGTIKGKIEARNISFRHADHERNVFSSLSFIIQPGESVAFVGPSGCGKTTLLKCLMGLYEPTEGEIFIDDIPIKQQSSYRSNIGSVMQDDKLMTGDISENITCFAHPIDLDRVYECTQIARIHKEIERMPMKYFTLIADSGANLSGGQIQRIVLARALYRKPKILFMDEATSHLDIENERIVNRHVNDLKITRIVVAHRPETILSADRTIDISQNQE